MSHRGTRKSSSRELAIDFGGGAAKGTKALRIKDKLAVEETQRKAWGRNFGSDWEGRG